MKNTTVLFLLTILLTAAFASSAQLPYTYGVVAGYDTRDVLPINDSIMTSTNSVGGTKYYFYKVPSFQLLQVTTDRGAFDKYKVPAYENIYRPLTVTSNDSLWTAVKSETSRSGPWLIKITNNLTGEQYEVEKLESDYSGFQMGFCGNNRYFYYSTYYGLKVIRLATMEEVYSIGSAVNNVQISPDEKILFVTYTDYQKKRTNLLVQTDNWQLLTKINFDSYIYFLGKTNKFFLKNNSEYPWKIVVTVWDLNKVYELAAANKLQAEYGLYDIAYVPTYEDRERKVVSSPKGNYVLVGNVLYNARTAEYLGDIPTPNVFGLEMATTFSDDDNYLRVHLLKYRVDMSKLDIFLDTLGYKELALPSFDSTPKGKLAGTYNGVLDKAKDDFIKANFSKELQSDLVPSSFPSYRNVSFSPKENKLFAVRHIKGRFDLGYFNGKGDKFKKICDVLSFKKADNEIGYLIYAGYNKDMTRALLVTQEKSEGPTINVKLVDLQNEKVISEHEKLSGYELGCFFADDDLRNMYCLKLDTIFKFSFDGEKLGYVVTENLATLMRKVKDVQYDNGSIWVRTTGPDYTLCKINLATGARELSFVWPKGVDKLFEFNEKDKAYRKAEEAKNEEERIRSANKFDAKKYKQKIKQERAEANNKLIKAIYDAAAKNPVYESCSDCGGKGTNSSFSINYTREVSGSWGYSSNYSNVTTMKTTNSKCTTCNGTGKAVCHRAACYNINAASIK